MHSLRSHQMWRVCSWEVPFCLSPSLSSTPRHTKHSSSRRGWHTKYLHLCCADICIQRFADHCENKASNTWIQWKQDGQISAPTGLQSSAGMRCAHPAALGCHTSLSSSCSKHGMSISCSQLRAFPCLPPGSCLSPLLSTRERQPAAASLLCLQRESSSSCTLTPFSPLSENTIASEWALHWKSYICQIGITFVKLLSSS